MIINIKGYNVIIDDEDYERVNKYSWNIHKNYVRTTIYIPEKKEIRLHRLLLGIENSDVDIDHINGNTLDNRKQNLRPCSHSENMQNCKKYINNTSDYKGVNFINNKWLARIQVNNKRIFLGYFNTPEKAYEAYCEASKKYHGEFGRLE